VTSVDSSEILATALGIVSSNQGQVWTFAVAGSFAIYLGVLLASCGFFRGTGHFILISLTVAMAAVACFGLHARWPAALVAMFVGAPR